MPQVPSPTGVSHPRRRERTPEKNGLFDDVAVPEMLDDNAFQKRGGDTRVPDSLGIHYHYGAAGADTKARRFSAFYALRAEEEILSLKKRREQRIERSPTAIGRAEPSRADEHMPRVWLHERLADKTPAHR